ncbi:MAG: PilZ domain-containing protein [Acidobacteriaceae bacterium]
MSHDAIGTERRSSPRFACAGDAEIVLPGGGLRFGGKIKDLSIGGCFLETNCRLERGTGVEIWMCAKGIPLRMAANLVVKRETGVGFRFYGVTARKMDMIRSLMAELAEEIAEHEQEPRAEAGVNGGPAETQMPACGCGAAAASGRRGWLRHVLDWMANRLRGAIGRSWTAG